MTKGVSIDKWQLTNMVDFSNLFMDVQKTVSFDLSKWDVSNSRSFKNMFNRAPRVSVGDISNWKTGKVRLETVVPRECEGEHKTD